MPQRPATICLDCNALTLPGKSHCARHVENNRSTRAARDREVERRKYGLKSLYDGYRWRKLTQPFILNRDPMCKIGILCEGRAASTDVDHIVRADLYIAAHGGDPIAFYDPDNLQGACHADHSHKTALENRGAWPVESSSARQVTTCSDHVIPTGAASTGGGNNL